MSVLRIGTRGSPLALWQARRVQELLGGARPGIEVEVITIRTSGDEGSRVAGAPGPGKGLFTKEIERALLDGRIDLAVHSLKDLAARDPDGLTLTAFPERADPRDALFTRDGTPLESLTAGSRVGTSSLRRAASLGARFPSLEVVPLRGNVETRMRRVTEGLVDAVVLALAGLTRLGKLGGVTPVDPNLMLPAPGQGALAVQSRSGDARVNETVRLLDRPEVRVQVTAERALLSGLGGDCNVPIGALTMRGETGAELVARVLSPDGGEVLEGRMPLDPGDPPAAGRRLAEDLLRRGADRLIARCRQMET